MALVSIDCPFCRTKNISCALIAIHPVRYRANKPNEAHHEGIGECEGCKSNVVLFFTGSHGRHLPLSDTKSIGLIPTSPQTGNSPIQLIGWLPETSGPEIPEHLPENVERAFLGAERSRLNKGWTEAAISYGRAVERGIAHLLPEDGPRRTLGQKLGWLRDNTDLPDALDDWIGVILKDRNFANHDEDHDFESEEEITIMRDLATIVLTYLHTMPKQIEIAREHQAKRAEGN